MIICMIMSTKFPPEEGLGNYVYNLSRKLIEKGHEVTIITRGSLRGIQKENIDDIRIFKPFFIPLYPFHVHLHGFFVSELLKSIYNEFDLIHIHSPLTPFIKTSLPVMTTIHSPMLADISQEGLTDFRSLASKITTRLISYPLEIRLLKRSDVITTVSRSAKRELKQYGINQSRIKVIGNGVNEKIFSPSQNVNDDRYILYTGWLREEKGLIDLVESGKYIIKKYPDISFVIAGRGYLLKELKKRAEKLGLKKNFKFVGYVSGNNLIKLYQNATIYIFPSYHEGLPTALLEAMSCGLPVIASAVRGNIDVISHGKNGILVPPKSPRLIANAISMLMNDEKLRKKLGIAARRTVEKKYTWDIISEKIIKCYESLLGSPL